MLSLFHIRTILPYFIFKRLFGDRKKYSNYDKTKDKDWILWCKKRHFFYEKKSNPLLKFIENKGYLQLRSVNFSNKKILEIGPGLMPHFKFIKKIQKNMICLILINII